MRVRRGSALDDVWEFYFNEGIPPNLVNHTDQDILNHWVNSAGLSHLVSSLDGDEIISFKETLRLSSFNLSYADSLYQQSLMVKFHGSPKPHELNSLLFDSWVLNYLEFEGTRLFLDKNLNEIKALFISEVLN
jgi:hypothetical protein